MFLLMRLYSYDRKSTLYFVEGNFKVECSSIFPLHPKYWDPLILVSLSHKNKVFRYEIKQLSLVEQLGGSVAPYPQLLL